LIRRRRQTVRKLWNFEQVGPGRFLSAELNPPTYQLLALAVTVVILVFANIYYLKTARDQAEAASPQAKESQRQADVAMENLKRKRSSKPRRN
jgi:hypothetical protein